MFSLSQLKNLAISKSSASKRPGFNISREKAALYGILLVVVIFTTLILWDGYLFYNTVLKQEEPEMFVTKVPNFSEGQVNEIIRLLDGRKQKFNELLGVTKETK